MRIRILSDESIEYLENNTERLVAKVLQGNESLADFFKLPYTKSIQNSYTKGDDTYEPV